MFTDVLESYCAYLGRQAISGLTRKNYLCRVSKYLDWLAGCLEPAAALNDPSARDYAVRDFRAKLLHQGAAPNTVNSFLAALDNFYGFLGLAQAKVSRCELPQLAPRALTPDEQKRFLRTIERCDSLRNRSIALLLFYTGLRISELAALNLEDVPVTARTGVAIVRCGKGDKHRQVPIHADVRKVLLAYLQDRQGKEGKLEDKAPLFAGSKNDRLAVRSIDHLIRQIGNSAGLEVSAHVLRHTCLSNLVRLGTDVVLVAQIAGHSRLETTRRYSLPTQKDLESAVAKLPSMIA